MSESKSPVQLALPWDESARSATATEASTLFPHPLTGYKYNHLNKRGWAQFENADGKPYFADPIALDAMMNTIMSEQPCFRWNIDVYAELLYARIALNNRRQFPNTQEETTVAASHLAIA